MAMPKVLDWLDDLVAQVATNVTNIAQNASDIAAHKAEFDTHAADDNRHWTETDRQNFDRTIHFKGYFISIEKLQEAYPEGQLGDYAIVGGSDTVWLWDDETSSWLNSTEQGVVISVNGKTGEIVLSKTDVGLGNVDNTSDINKPVSTAQQTALDAKTGRRKITLAESEMTSLRSGTYYILDESRTILGFSSSYWVVIIAEQSIAKSATQIWMNYNTGANPRMFMRNQTVDSDTWGEFVEVLTTLHLTTITNDINEMKTNIQTNATDIDALELDKFDRINDTSMNMESFNNSTGLRAGIYNVIGGANDNSVTEYLVEQGHTFTEDLGNWAVLCFETKYSKNGGYEYQSRSQMFFNTSEHRVFFRNIDSNGQWTDFVEILSTQHLTLEDVARAKQYKGYFSQIVDLRDTITEATEGDYAIVGNALYIWDARIESWVEVSGSGGGEGSTGTRKWSIKKYVANGVLGDLEQAPQMRDLIGRELLSQIEVEDTDSWLVNETEDTLNRYYLTETYIEMAERTIVEAEFYQAFMGGVSIYINDELVYSHSEGSVWSGIVTYPFIKGWNKIQILGHSVESVAKYYLSTKFTAHRNCLRMDCYHSENPIIQAYVPLVGDSAIDGNITVSKSIGLTEKSYIQYNEYDNSISFMFNE